MDVLRQRFGVDGNALTWVAKFLSNRRQVVYAGKSESDNISLQFGVPHGSVLGPRVFAQYAEEVADIFQRHEVRHHLFADDMQGHRSGRLDYVPAIVSRPESCIADIYVWRGAKRLQLNAEKTELLWFSSASQLRQLPSQSSAVHVNQCVVKPVTVVRDLAVWFDDELSMRSHVSRVTQTCFYHLRHIVPSVDSSAAMSQRD